MTSKSLRKLLEYSLERSLSPDAEAEFNKLTKEEQVAIRLRYGKRIIRWYYEKLLEHKAKLAEAGFAADKERRKENQNLER